MADSQVTFALRDDGVAEVVLGRPDVLNALTLEMFERLHEVAAEASAAAGDGRCRAVLVRGEGRAFCAGLDRAVLARSGVAAGGFDDARIDRMQGAFTALEDLPVPVVAALAGPVVGAGCQLALACHIRLAAPDTTIGLAEVRWGLLPDLGATWRLPRLVGLGRATHLAVTGATLDAATALSWGMADLPLDGDDSLGAARSYAAALAAGPPLAVGALPALLRAAADGTRADALAAERAAQQRCLASVDFPEAVAAALQQRPARFTGH